MYCSVYWNFADKRQSQLPNAEHAAPQCVIININFLVLYSVCDFEYRGVKVILLLFNIVAKWCRGNNGDNKRDARMSSFICVDPQKQTCGGKRPLIQY